LIFVFCFDMAKLLNILDKSTPYLLYFYKKMLSLLSRNCFIMESLEHKVKNFINNKALLTGKAPVIVAISGGADSVALLAVLNALGYECVAAHCNFHLRGEESMRDMEHVRTIAAQLNVSLQIKDFNVHEQMRLTGQSIEMACRDLRYAWFRQLLADHHAQAIAVGHHREDQVETFMLNLLRGTGIAGLTGMAPSAANVVRPLIECSRAEIEQYLTQRGLNFITDSSNAQNDYKRNKLRNIIIPSIEQHFTGASDAILATMSHLSDNKLFYDYAVNALSAPFVDASGSINIDALRKTLPLQVARMLLFEMLKPHGFNITHIANMLNASATATFVSPTHTAELSRGMLSIVINTDVDNSQNAHKVTLDNNIDTPIHISISEHNIAQFAPKRNNNIIYLDAEALSNDPVFELRHWQQGDTMQPFGMAGSKLLSDIFADAKLSAAQKREVWILTRNGEILWVIGLRASQHFAVNAQTKTYLQLTAHI
jgi:tRNA(Ile)-lysidine synthase